MSAAPDFTGEIDQLLRLVLGPVSATVLMSLHQIGLPAMLEQLGDLRRAVEADDGLAPRSAAIRRAVLAWRLNGLVGRLAEQLGGLTEAVDAWIVAGEPVFADGRLGETFLRSQPRNPRGTFERFSKAQDVRRLLGYPAPASLVGLLDKREIHDLDRRLKRSAEATAAVYEDAASAMTDESHRTFVRWKHAVSITSPLSVPVWIAETDEATKIRAMAGMASGFGIVDLDRHGDERARVVIWPDAAGRLEEAMSLAADLANVTNLVVESVLCWADPRIPAIPVFPSVASTAHKSVLDKLARLHYRRRLAKRALELSAFGDDPE